MEHLEAFKEYAKKRKIVDKFGFCADDLKFRIYNKEKNEFYYHSIKDFFNYAIRRVENPQVSQYTGIKTKDRKEIYVNDIIFQDCHYFKVVFFCGTFCLKPLDFMHSLFDNLYRIDDYFCKIVGNVYQNADLLADLEKKRVEDEALFLNKNAGQKT